MTNWKKSLSSILSIKILNRYVLATILFTVWVGFFDKYDYFTQRKLSASLAQIEEDLANQKAQIELAKIEKEHLENNKEKIAREKYLMHRENEQIFLIEK
jgi:cell division protein FtsB